MKNDNNRLVELVRKLSIINGCNKTKIDYLKIYQFTESTIEMPKLDNPYIYIILDGELRLHTPSGIMDYMPGQYSISAIDTPNDGYVIYFSKQNDFLASSIEFTTDDVISVILELNDELIKKIIKVIFR